MLNITEFIGVGRENAVTRRELANILHLPDRTIRRLIADARNSGELIVNDGSGDGYYISDDLGELYKQLSTNRRRALSILQQQKHLWRRIAELNGADQMTIDEIMEDIDVYMLKLQGDI